MNDCYIDLHLHIDGAVSPATAIAVAKMEGIALPTTDEKELLSYLEVPKDSKDLVDYLKTFDLPVSLMQSRAAISEVTYRVQEDLRAQGVIYAELRFAPQLHTQKGLPQREVVKAALEGLERSSLKSNLILCCMRFADNQAANLETVRVAEEFLNKGVVGLDIAGSEADGPIENYADIFKKAKESGIPFTIHAGEAAGADSVRKAVEMGASRIGHGVRSIEDASVVKLLADRKIPLELCPTSNLNTRVFETLAAYPLKKLMDSGVIVTINSDNPIVSATNVKREMQILKEQFQLSDKDIRQLLMNAANASFADTATKEYIKNE